jgi:hypothetical protein
MHVCKRSTKQRSCISTGNTSPTIIIIPVSFRGIRIILPPSPTGNVYPRSHENMRCSTVPTVVRTSTCNPTESQEWPRSGDFTAELTSGLSVHTLLLYIGLSGHWLGMKIRVPLPPLHQPSAGKDFWKRGRTSSSVKVHRTEHLVQPRQLAVSEIGSTTGTIVAASPRWKRKTAPMD